jgi:hypothetical protein
MAQIHTGLYTSFLPSMPNPSAVLRSIKNAAYPGRSNDGYVLLHRFRNRNIRLEQMLERSDIE